MVPLAHPLAQCPQLSLRQLERESLIFSRRHSYTQQTLETLARESGVTLKSGILIDSRTDICAAVAHGLGIGFAFRGDIPSQGQHAVVPIAEATQAITEHVVWLKGRSDLPEVRCFVELAVQASAARSGSDPECG